MAAYQKLFTLLTKIDEVLLPDEDEQKIESVTLIEADGAMKHFEMRYFYTRLHHDYNIANDALRRMSLKDRIDWLSEYLKLWRMCGQQNWVQNMLHITTPSMNAEHFGKPLMYTLARNSANSQSNLTLRIWFSPPRYIKENHADSSAGTLLDIHGPKEVVRWCAQHFMTKEDKAHYRIINGVEVWGAELEPTAE